MNDSLKATPERLPASAGSAFAQWSHCIYKGAILCADCDKLKESYPGADDECDMAAVRQGRQKAFDAGFRARMLHRDAPQAERIS